MQKGSLYIIATPIGNLKDITLRALDVLKSVDLVLSEDTRETAKIFREYGIERPQISYRDQNHDRVIENIISQLEAGQTLALVCDSGTPLISDPGYKLVRDVLAKGFEVVAVPGASSIIAGFTVSGLPTDKFSFVGFLPRTSGSRAKIIKEFGQLDSTLILFESPYRIYKLLKEIKENLGLRKIALVNELTKKFEKVYRGNVDELLSSLEKTKFRGEFVIYVAKEGI